MTALDLPGVRLYGPVQTAVSSPDAAPRYLLRRRGVTMRCVGRGRLHAAHVREIREWAEARPWLTQAQCITALQARYPLHEETVRDVLQNRSWANPDYTPADRPVSDCELSALACLVVWLTAHQHGREKQSA